jgi:formylmethanofuran dehydrogenase subunit C
MTGGSIHIQGKAGDFLAGALPGEQRGMSGGDIIVHGDAGDRVGDRMRRGTILVEGDVGSYCASRMVAGTIAVWGKAGENTGFAMSRGTLLLRQAPERMLPTFNDCGEHDLGFLRLMLRAWSTLPSRFARLPGEGTRVRRYVGDLANGGKGEILVWR